jgi:hypothetical protein
VRVGEFLTVTNRELPVPTPAFMGEAVSEPTELSRISLLAARHWTPEQRQAQAERKRAWKPWERSTGPRIATGRLQNCNHFKKRCHPAEQSSAHAQAALSDGRILSPTIYQNDRKRCLRFLIAGLLGILFDFLPGCRG